ncbi:MAG: hypothetical protein HQL26_09470 [Candidatus Omnitrophica bacterium]|nr:hypothetical protein [Candidatus Omnitrophota bacterium]
MLKIFKIIIINLLILAALFLAAEVFCRLVKIPYKEREMPPETHVCQFDPLLGWTYESNKEVNYKFGNPPRTVPLYFDQEGIRVPSAGYQFDLKKPSVLLAGCSFTMGHGVPYEESFAGQLAQDQAFPYQVVNLGVQAYGTDQSLLRLKQLIKKFNTKWVVYTFIDDHISRNGNYDRRMLYKKSIFPGTKPLFALDKNKELCLVKNPLLYKNYFNSWFADTIQMRLGRLLGLFPPMPYDLTEALIREMKRVTEDAGARFVIVDWFIGGEKSYGFIQNLSGVDVIGTKDIFGTWDDRFRIKGDGHPNAVAHALIAQKIKKYINGLPK